MHSTFLTTREASSDADREDQPSQLVQRQSQSIIHNCMLSVFTTSCSDTWRHVVVSTIRRHRIAPHRVAYYQHRHVDTEHHCADAWLMFMTSRNDDDDAVVADMTVTSRDTVAQLCSSSRLNSIGNVLLAQRGALKCYVRHRCRISSEIIILNRAFSAAGGRNIHVLSRLGLVAKWCPTSGSTRY